MTARKKVEDEAEVTREEAAARERVRVREGGREGESEMERQRNFQEARAHAEAQATAKIDEEVNARMKAMEPSDEQVHILSRTLYIDFDIANALEH